MDKVVLAGNNLAVLIAAKELAKSKIYTTLYTDKQKIGGHFAGVTIDNINFDIGMVVFEDYVPKETNLDLKSFNPTRLNDWTRFGDHINSWINANVNLARIPTLKTFFEGQYFPDFIMSNRLDVLKGKEINFDDTVDDNSELHASKKFSSPEYLSISYGEACLANHGKEFQDKYIEPFVTKLTEHSSNRSAAQLHRKIWSPLYYPETLKLALSVGHKAMPEYPFWTNNTGFSGQLIHDLTSYLAKSEFIEIIEDPIESIRKENNGQAWTVKTEHHQSVGKLGLGILPTRAKELLHIAPSKDQVHESASVKVLFALVKKSSIKIPVSALLVVDHNFSCYRITNQDHCAGIDNEWQRVTVEANPVIFDKLYANADNQEFLKKELISLLSLDSADDVKVLKTIKAPNAISVPSLELVEDKSNLYQAIKSIDHNIHLSGNLMNLGMSSINDQVMQGIYMANQFNQ